MNDIVAKAYHAGVADEDDGVSQRADLEQQLLGNHVKVLVATVALGMGFDKPDLGFVIHFQRPASVVHYYQQVGRAGRAVDEAFGILLHGEEDDHIADFFIRSAFPPQQHVDTILHELDKVDGGLVGPRVGGEAEPQALAAGEGTQVPLRRVALTHYQDRLEMERDRGREVISDQHIPTWSPSPPSADKSSRRCRRTWHTPGVLWSSWRGRSMIRRLGPAGSVRGAWERSLSVPRTTMISPTGRRFS